MLAALRLIYNLRAQHLSQIELAGSRFLAEGGKPEYSEKNPRSQIEIDKSQPTCEAQDSNPGRTGGMCEWRSLRQPDSPLNTKQIMGFTQNW